MSHFLTASCSISSSQYCMSAGNDLHKWKILSQNIFTGKTIYRAHSKSIIRKNNLIQKNAYIVFGQTPHQDKRNIQ